MAGSRFIPTRIEAEGRFESGSYDDPLKRGLALLLAVAAPLVVASSAFARDGRTEVVVTLDAPSLARAISQSRVLTESVREKRLDLKSPTSMAYLRGLASAQHRLERAIGRNVPSARVRWRYRIVLDALAVDLPRAAVPRLRKLPGVAKVFASASYHALGSAQTLLNQTPALIGAPTLWGPSLSTAGNGIKIGIIDDGIDQTHPFFGVAGLKQPPGFPRGNRAYTTGKVIVARAFAPRSPKWQYANKPFDPKYSDHATHVAGIAAGDNGLRALGTTISGIAPKAYIGNYKVLTIPTVSGVGLDGNAPEIAKGIEAAVADGMDVINLSLGEPEVEPKRDIVAKAINGAAAAGVVPAIAAGNDFDTFGRGSIGSPGSAARAITAAAADKSRVIASFSSAGPTPVSLQMKPDVTAPGVNVLSSVPRADGLWDSFSGTSMASPHVAGAAGLLRERHPTWTVEQIKSALELTAGPVYSSSSHASEVTSIREGGGLIYLPRADDPKIFAAPTGISFGLVHPGERAARSIQLTNAGGGSGTWAVAVEQRRDVGSVSVTAPGSLAVPANLAVSASVSAGAAESDVTGFVVLRKGPDTRRIPFWLRVTSPRLQRHRQGRLRRTGTYRGNTSRQQALIDTYRYPDNPSGAGIPADLRGPEQVFRFRLTRRVANFGIAVLNKAPGVAIQPRVVASADENRLTGYPALPINLNPYLAAFFHPAPAAGAVLPEPGTYDLVFDSTTRANAGRFTFRFWINDKTRPTVRLLTRRVVRGGSLRLRVADRGSGVDPALLEATVDGVQLPVSYTRAKRVATVSLARAGTLTTGRHKLVFQASDYQETRNMENVGPILPNTRTLTARFRVR